MTLKTLCGKAKPRITKEDLNSVCLWLPAGRFFVRLGKIFIFPEIWVSLISMKLKDLVIFYLQILWYNPRQLSYCDKSDTVNTLIIHNEMFNIESLKKKARI